MEHLELIDKIVFSLPLFYPCLDEDKNKNQKAGVDEQFIKFQSPPSFKVMKKFISSKINKISNGASPNPPDPPPPPSLDIAVKIKPEVQIAPDTLEPSTSGLDVPTKVENEYEENGSDRDPSVNFDRNYASDKSKDPAKPPESSIMCRDFVRGTCKRPGTCRYAHKCDTTQLLGVYTFCRNFQNKVCTLPNCKYVHATIFEEQEFYRTGKLPPNVLVVKPPQPQQSQPSQSQPQPQQQQQQPPPLPPPPSEVRLDIPTSFSNPPPPLPNMSVDGPPPMLGCHHANAPESSRMYQDAFGDGAAARGEAEGPVAPKRCKLCDITLLRKQYHEDVVERKRKSLAEWKRRNADLDAKKDKLNAIVAGLLKYSANASGAGSSSSSVPNFNGNDHNKAPMNSNYVASLLANLLVEDPSGDPSRKD